MLAQLKPKTTCEKNMTANTKQVEKLPKTNPLRLYRAWPRPLLLRLSL